MFATPYSTCSARPILIYNCVASLVAGHWRAENFMLIVVSISMTIFLCSTGWFTMWITLYQHIPLLLYGEAYSAGCNSFSPNKYHDPSRIDPSIPIPWKHTIPSSIHQKYIIDQSERITTTIGIYKKKKELPKWIVDSWSVADPDLFLGPFFPKVSLQDRGCPWWG